MNNEDVIQSDEQFDFTLKDVADDKKGFSLRELYAMNASKKGREPNYMNGAELHNKIHKYLIYEDKTSKGKYTISGCAMFLGFATRQSLYNYRDRDDELGYVMKRYFLFLQHYQEQRLSHVTTFQGAQFWLKNFSDYRDVIDQNVNQKVTNVQASFGSALSAPPQSGTDSQVDNQ